MRTTRLLLVGFLLFCCSPVSAIVISEIMYHPQTDEPHNEWVEIYNETAARIDLSRWQFNEGIDFVFSSGTLLQPRSYLVIARDPATVMSRYGIANVVGPFLGALNNSSDHVILRDPAGGIMAEVDYQDDGKWPVAADGAGHSLSKFVMRGDPMDPDNWRASPLPGGTPGRDNGFQPWYEDSVLIAPGDIWSYFKGVSEATTPIDRWRQISFVTSGPAWLQGPTGIGYADGDDATTVTGMQQGVPPPPGNPGFWSIYCRKTFTVSDPTAIDQMFLEVDHDDGFIAYLNNTDVGRAAMSTTGPVLYNTPATGHSAVVDGGTTTILDLTPYKGALVAGTNVLAVQVHNNVLNSTDLTFIPRLKARKVHLPGQAASPVIINEVCFHTSGTQFIELYNTSDAPINVGRYYLSNDPDNLHLFQISSGTMIGARDRLVFRRNQLGFAMNTADDRVLLTSPTLDVVVDARAVEPGPKDWSTGRWPDGDNTWYNMEPTTGTANSVTLTTSVVINEIMYHPPSDDVRDEYIELFNVGATSVSLTGWDFSQGINYNFAPGTVIGPRRYMVLARDRDRLISRYGLPPSIVLGYTSGTLKDGGDRVRLRDANRNEADEVRYHDGGHWPEYADGYGSSLELIDPRQDNGNYQAWAASDERSKAQWTFFSVSGIANVPADYHEHELHLMLLGHGEALIDDVHLTQSATEYIGNGTFESGLSGWLPIGTHVYSNVTSTDAHGGSRSLRIVATGAGDPGANHVETTTSLPLTNGQTYTLTFWAKWQWGNNLLVSRLWDNPVSTATPPPPGGLRETNVLPIPSLTGTPGTTNSVYRANMGPVFGKVGHLPVTPNAGNSVTVRAKISDADGVSSAIVFFKPDTAGSYTPVAMYDNGTGGDSMAGDGIWTATIPPRANNQTVAFYLMARDTRGTTGCWPSDITRPAHYWIEAGPWVSNFPRYRIVMTQAERNLLSNRPHLSNDPLNCTFIFDESDVYYNCGVTYTGSPYGRGGGGYRGYDVTMNADERLHGLKLHARWDWGQNSGYNDRISYDLLRAMGLATCPVEFVASRINGTNQGSGGIGEDITQPGKDYLDRFFRGDADGQMFELSSRYEFTDDNDLIFTAFVRNEPTWLDWGNDKDLYRWNWRVRNHDRADDFTSMVLAIKAVSHVPNLSAEAEIANLIDVQQWMRVMAVRSTNSDWDFFGTGETKNAYLYWPTNGRRWRLLPWDCELGFGTGTEWNRDIWCYRAELSQIRTFQRFRGHEHFFLNSMHEYMAKYFNHAYMDPWIDYYFSLVGGHNAAAFKTFVTSRTLYLQTQMAPYLPPTIPFAISTSGPLVIPEFSANLSGVAPIHTSWIRYGGVLFWPVWSDATHWSVTLTNVPPGSSAVTLEFLDYDKVLIGTASINVNAPTQPLAFVTDFTGVTVPEGGTVQFRVKLNWMPVSNLTASVSRAGGDADISVASGGSLTFTQANWSIYQTVTLSAALDVDTFNGQATIRVHAVTGPFAPDSDVTATESDNFSLQYVTDVSALSVPEGATAQFRVRLNAAPTGSVQASVARIAGDGDISVQSGASLTFTAANWNAYQTVTLAAAADADTTNGQATIRIHTTAGLAAPDKDVIATEADNTLRFVTDVVSLLVLEGGTAPFRVKLNAQPPATVTVSVSRISGDGDISVQVGANLTFTTSNWNTFQTVTLAAALDPDTLNNQAVVRVHALSGAAVPDKDVVAREGDLGSGVRRWREY